NAYDSSLFARFGIYSIPDIFFVDPNGVIRAITDSDQLTEEKIDSLIKGEDPDLKVVKNEAENKVVNKFNINKPFLIHGNGGPDSVFMKRSVLTGYQQEITNPLFNYRDRPLGFQSDKKILIINQQLEKLYLAAYGDTLPSFFPTDKGYGLFWPKVFL